MPTSGGGAFMLTEMSLFTNLAQLTNVLNTVALLPSTTDFIAIDQPRVAWRLQAPVDRGTEFTIGPDDTFFYGVLDTGANGVVIGAAGYFEFTTTGNGYAYNYDRYEQATHNGTTVRYDEIGVAGTQSLDLLAPYDLHIWGRTNLSATEALPPAFSIADTNILGAVHRDANGAGVDASDFGSFSAIVGMPAMYGRKVKLDLRPMAGDLGGFGGGTSNPDVVPFDLMTAEYVSSIPDTQHSVRVRLSPLILPGGHTPDPGGPPLPTFADVPQLTVTYRRTAAGTAATRNVLLDTGAQTSMISTNTAAALGFNLDRFSEFTDILDINSDLQITDDDMIEVGGLGGDVILMPLVLIDELRVATLEDGDLVFRNLVVGVLDIGGEGDAALLDGIFGMNMLTTGYSDLMFAGNGDYGRFLSIHFDFTEDGSWFMQPDQNPALLGEIAITPEPASMSLLAFGALGLLRRRRRNSSPRTK